MADLKPGDVVSVKNTLNFGVVDNVLMDEVTVVIGGVVQSFKKEEVEPV